MSMIWSNLDLNRSSFPLFSGFLDRIAARLAATKRIIIRPAWTPQKRIKIARFLASNRRTFAKTTTEKCPKPLTVHLVRRYERKTK